MAVIGKKIDFVCSLAITWEYASCVPMYDSDDLFLLLHWAFERQYCLERTLELFLSSVGHIQSGSKASKLCWNVFGEAFINYLFNEFLAVSMNTVGFSPF